MSTVTMQKPFGFSLAAAAEFYRGFTPGSGMAAMGADAHAITFAFRQDKTYEAVAVRLTERGDALALDIAGGDVEVALRQVSRILGLDVDGRAWLAVGERDRVVGRLQREFAGFFTAAKPSPYDAAVWGILQPRMPMKQAARIKMAMAEKHGDVVAMGRERFFVFPSPKQLLAIESFAGVSDEKMKRLHGIARAAQDGALDADRLRAMHEDDALDDLQRLPGVGPWTAGHIFYRGAAIEDALPLGEPRVLHGMAAAYGKSAIDVEEAIALAEAWRPFRMWVCVLFARYLGRIGGWQNPSLQRERAEAGRRIARKSSSLRLRAT